MINVRVSTFLAIWVAALTLPGSAPASQQGGLVPEWDANRMIQKLSAEIQRVDPILGEIQVESWIAKGASAAYREQWQDTREEVRNVLDTLGRLAAQPDRVKIALEAFLRVQAVDGRLFSLADGIRRYQNPALAELLEGTFGESAGARQWLRQYLVDLVNAKEEEFLIIDREAQQCRAQTITQPLDRSRPAAEVKRP